MSQFCNVSCQNLCFSVLLFVYKLFEFWLLYPSVLSVVQSPCVLVSAVCHLIDCIPPRCFPLCVIISQSLCYLNPSVSIFGCLFVFSCSVCVPVLFFLPPVRASSAWCPSDILFICICQFFCISGFFTPARLVWFSRSRILILYFCPVWTDHLVFDCCLFC